MRLFKFFMLLIVLFILGCGIGFGMFMLLGSDQQKGDSVAVIRLQGIIINQEGKEGTIDSNQVISVLDRLHKDKRYKGIILVVDSPGGMAAPSLEICEKIRRIKKDKPVVVYIESLGASGAYYFASAANYIISNPKSLVGSIGVIISVPQVHKAMDKIGIQIINIKSGYYKDAFSPFKPLQKDQQQYLQNLVMEYYYQFVSDISKNRNLKTQQQIKELYEISDGRVFSARTALKYGLIDQIGFFDDAKDKMKEILGKKDIKFIELKLYKKTPLDRLLGTNLMKEVYPRIKYGVWMIAY
ncbi:MAG: signal peptide peptidase SppA [bacterium]